LELADGTGLSEGCSKVSEDIDWEKQWAATIRQGIMRMLACYEEVLEGKKRLSHSFIKVIFRDSCFATCFFGHWR
jgi:hypothetical protein